MGAGVIDNPVWTPILAVALCLTVVGALAWLLWFTAIRPVEVRAAAFRRQIADDLFGPFE